MPSHLMRLPTHLEDLSDVPYAPPDDDEDEEEEFDDEDFYDDGDDEIEESE